MSLSIAIVGLPNKDKDTLLIYMIKLASNVSLRITLRSFTNDNYRTSKNSRKMLVK